MNKLYSGTPCRRLQKRRGFTYIEILMSSLIVGICIAGLISIWYFSYKLSLQTDRLGIAYSIGRQSMEKAKQTGFTYTAVGSTTFYYDKAGENESVTLRSIHSFYTTTTVTAGTAGAGTAGLLVINIEVFQLPDSVSLYKTKSYFTKAGI